MNIYELARRVDNVRVALCCMSSSAKEHKVYKGHFTEKAINSIETLKQVGYLTYEEQQDLTEQVYHLARVTYRKYGV